MGMPKEDLIEMVACYNAKMEEADFSDRAELIRDGLLVKVTSGDDEDKIWTPEEFASLVGNL